ncbi:MAG: tetratricopeptide repeat protein [Bradymonadaceae bacterium]
MAEIYYRDGLSWLSLDAIEASLHCFQRSLDYHPGRGDALAYHAYLQFKNSPNSPRVAETCRDELRTAANIAPQNPEIHVLRARFALESGLADLAEDCLMRIRDIDPDHPDLPKLESVHEELVQD